MSQRKNIGKVVVSISDFGFRIADSDGQTAIRKTQSEIRKIRSDGTYLITGGLGALGLRVAKWMAEQGAAAVALLSRRAASHEAEQSLDEIRATGARVVVVQGDVTDAESLPAALAQLPAALPPLRGVVHAAGALADGILSEMTLDQLDRALAPKVRGAWNLHAATQELPLDFFVLFSSVASVLGSPGQANYAAGNAFLDALAHARRAAGLPATAINWGPWAGSGMAVEAGLDGQSQPRGMSLIEPRDGLDLLGKLLKSDRPQVAVMNAGWADMLKLLGSRRPALLSEIAAEVEAAGGDVGASRVDHAFRQRLIAADAATRQSLVQDYIRQELARIMGIEPGSLETNQPLSTFGLDSLLALELKNNLEGRLDFTLPMARLMEGPSIASLAAETSRLLAGGEGGSGDGERAASSAETIESWTPLVLLQSGGSQPPLVLLPALGGDARYYADLVQQLDDDRPVYVFRPRGLDQDLPPHVTIDEAIRDYVAALREIQPTGPYHLAGWSTGGTFAFALAEAIERAGEEVALLALMDSPMPSLCDDIDVADDAHFFCDLVNFANRCSGVDVRIDYDKLAGLPQSEQFAAAIAEARSSGMIPPEMPESFILRLVHVGESNVRVLQSYRPKVLSASILFFVPETRGALAELSGRTPPSDEDLGWSREVGQAVELRVIPGDHFSMMTGDGSKAIAEELSKVLNAQPATAAPAT
jgi:thioesterase domain-containing protein/NAD(P)-dependent dehydrogenase (short-subunit alcohol dehydrogenase family)/acyl carrier protein